MARTNYGLPGRASSRPRGGCGWLVVLPIILLALLVCILIGALVFYAAQPAQAGTPEVSIQEPAPGARVWANHSNTVFAIARHPTRMARVELWVDGQFVEGRASSAPDGTNPFPTAFDWKPQPGAHSIFLVAYSTDSRAGQSYVITVNAEPVIAQPGLRAPTPEPTPQPTSTPVGQPTPSSSPSPPGQPTPSAQPAQPTPSAQPGQPGQPGQVGQPDQPGQPREPVIFGPPLPIRDRPYGPDTRPENLTADLIGACRVRLRWTDTSAEEVGYHIFRRAAANAIPERISIVGANTTEFTSDLPRAGNYQFYVTRLVPGHGEWGRSNTVAVNAAVCPAAGTRRDVELVIGADSLSTIGPYSEIYCYAQIGLGLYDRIPEGDATIRPVGGAYDIRDHFAGDNARTIIWVSDAPLPFNGECWGVRGVTVDFLGRFSKQHPPEEWDGRELTLNASGVSGQPGGGVAGFRLTYRIYRRDLLPAGQNWLLTDAEIPAPFNLSGMLDASPEEIARCLSNVFAGQIDISQIDRDLCAKNWALMWDWVGNAYVSDGPGATNRLDGFRVYLRRWIPGQSGSENMYVAAETYSGRARGAIAPYRVCGQNSEYRVTAFFGTHESPKSRESILTRGNPCKAYVRVTFDTLENIVRGTFAGMGSIYVNDQRRGWGCPTPGFGEGVPCAPVNVGGGRTASWSNLLFDPSDREFIVPLDENDTLTIGFEIVNDEDFGGAIWVESRTIALRGNMDWATFRSGSLPVGGPSFTSYVTVNGLGPPDPGAGAGGGGVRTDLEVESLYALPDENLHVVIRNRGPQFVLNEFAQINYENSSYEQMLTIPVGGSATIELPVQPVSNRVRVKLIPLSFIDLNLNNNEAERNLRGR